MKVELKNIKHARFASQETQCFEATIVIDGKRAGTVSNDGHGGCNFYDFADPTLETRFHDYCRSLPPVDPATLGLPPLSSGEPLLMTADWFIDTLVDKILQTQETARLCKGKTVFRLKSDKPGAYWTLKAPFSTAIKDHLVAKYGDTLEEILNEKLAS